MVVMAHRIAPRATAASSLRGGARHAGAAGGQEGNKLGWRASDHRSILTDCRAARRAGGGEGMVRQRPAGADSGRTGLPPRRRLAQAASTPPSLRPGPPPVRPALSTSSTQFNIAALATLIDAARLLRWRGAQLGRGCAHARVAESKLFARGGRQGRRQLRLSRRLRLLKTTREKFFRDVKLLTIGEGTSEIQRMVIARQLLA